MAFTEIYVDPSLNSDTGAGTVGDPFGDLEFAIEQSTFDTTNGTRVNIKAGTDEVLAADLSTALADTSVSIAWAPAENRPLIFQGYTSTAGDGGIGGISGGGSVGILNSATLDAVFFIDLHLHNCGAANVIDLDNECAVINCEVDNTTGNGVLLDNNGVIQGCLIHNIGGVGAQVVSAGRIAFNRFVNGTNDFTVAIQPGGVVVDRNIIDIDGTSNGIVPVDNAYISNNSIYSNGGTGIGIELGFGAELFAVTNNIVEGFSGAGGVGFDMDGASRVLALYGGNAAYNNETNYGSPDQPMVNYGDNETLTASPFTDAANGDFSPVNTGNVKEGSLPNSFHA